MSVEDGESRLHPQVIYLNKVMDRTPNNNSSSSQPCASRTLKFGMDRILSDDIAPFRKSPLRIASEEPVVSVSVSSTTPCSECVSSLLRCCRLSRDPPYIRTFYPPVLHSPRPVRPYTNLIVESEASDKSTVAGAGASKRKRSWSRAVFSNLQRKGLEKRFQIQKYITKPDRRQLAATLGLTDAQVKVWFQNRRMKWRHSKELKFHSASFPSSSSQVDVFPSSSPNFHPGVHELNN